jgi:glycosyltransferase involved in cell wall biosynthesis
VSILIPAYNAEKWIDRAVDSAVKQTWPRKEIIIVNDGSTDRTLEVAQRFASATVKVVTQENQGAAAARNKALSLSQGTYVQWLDADDLLAIDKISKQMTVLQGASKWTLTSSAWGRFFHRLVDADFTRTSLWCDLTPAEWLMRKMTDNVYMQTAAWLVSRELTDAAGAWNTQMLGDDDGEYFARVLVRADYVRFVAEAKVFYRRTGFNTLSQIALSNEKMDADFHSVQLQIAHLRGLEDSERARRACVAYLQHSLDHYYPARPDIVEQASTVAASLGGRLTIPRFSWKYGWLNTLFGPAVAKRAQIFLPQISLAVARLWDKALFSLENRRQSQVRS